MRKRTGVRERLTVTYKLQPIHEPWCQDHDDEADRCSSRPVDIDDKISVWLSSYPSGRTQLVIDRPGEGEFVDLAELEPSLFGLDESSTMNLVSTEALVEAMAKAGTSVRDLAESCNLRTHSLIQQLRTGKRHSCSATVAFKIAKRLSAPVGLLFTPADEVMAPELKY